MNSANIFETFSLWGGLECSVTRNGDFFYDQIVASGHETRASDLDLISKLGLKVLRYPVLWERTVRYRERRYDWSWSDERLQMLASAGITPIAGLLHHGSGPAWTSLLDDDFPQHFADYAYQVAKRYPELTYYTPINEPLTTARFSGLYGYWYPHSRSDRDFIKILFNQCEGTMRAMEAIRSINPYAVHVQTEDLGFVDSTDVCRYQADFENLRRWLSLDILCGMFDDTHPLMSYLLEVAEVSPQMLSRFQKKYPQPDILGFNHYVTSNRFLDHRFENYPLHAQAHNLFHQYADVEAVRVKGMEALNLDSLLYEASTRYNLPIALTEIHLSGPPEAQMRWLLQNWQLASALSTELNICGLTCWALLGLYDWDTLTVNKNNHYEPGAFEVSQGAIQPTSLAALVRELAISGSVQHLPESSRGWWEQPQCILYSLA